VPVGLNVFGKTVGFAGLTAIDTGAGAKKPILKTVPKNPARLTETAVTLKNVPGGGGGGEPGGGGGGPNGQPGIPLARRFPMNRTFGNGPMAPSRDCGRPLSYRRIPVSLLPSTEVATSKTFAGKRRSRRLSSDVAVVTIIADTANATPTMVKSKDLFIARISLQQSEKYSYNQNTHYLGFRQLNSQFLCTFE
jgi:hypothetical protein